MQIQRGGRFSGRLTASLSWRRSRSEALYSTLGIEITAYTVQIGQIKANEIDLENAKKIDMLMMFGSDLTASDKMKK